MISDGGHFDVVTILMMLDERERMFGSDAKVMLTLKRVSDVIGGGDIIDLVILMLLLKLLMMTPLPVVG